MNDLDTYRAEMRARRQAELKQIAEARKVKHAEMARMSKMNPEERAALTEQMRKEEWEARGKVAAAPVEFAQAFDKDDHGGYLVRPSTLWDHFKEEEYDTDPTPPPPIATPKKDPWWKKLKFWK